MATEPNGCLAGFAGPNGKTPDSFAANSQILSIMIRHGPSLVVQWVDSSHFRLDLSNRVSQKHHYLACMKIFRLNFAYSLILALLFCPQATADITDFNNWTLVEDPADPNFGSSIDSASQVTLTATGGPIPSGFDIGFSSVNGSTPLSSTQGYYFDPSNSFSVAIDFAMSFENPLGTMAFGFGIGEDAAGANSAGVTLVTDNGSAVGFGAAARTDDMDAGFGPIILGPQLAARMIATYDAATGNIELGVSTNGDDIAEGSFLFNGLQNDWNDSALLVSFFIRSDDVLANPWQSGLSNTVVTDFHVISGSAMAVVPEPQSAVFLVYGISAFFASRRKSRAN